MNTFVAGSFSALALGSLALSSGCSAPTQTSGDGAVAYVAPDAHEPLDAVARDTGATQWRDGGSDLPVMRDGGPHPESAIDAAQAMQEDTGSASLELDASTVSIVDDAATELADEDAAPDEIDAAVEDGDAGALAAVDGGSPESDAGIACVGGDPLVQTCRAADECFCGQGCACEMTCTGGSSCLADCAGESTRCTIDGRGAPWLDTECRFGATCEVSATGTSDAEIACMEASTCSVDATGAANAKLVCSGGSRCTLEASGSSHTATTCEGGSRCTVSCDGAADCTLACAADSECVLSCAGATSCGLVDCPDAIDCGDGVLACHVACP